MNETLPAKDMLAVAEHLKKHVNATEDVVKSAQAVCDFAAAQPGVESECPSLSPEGLALELERRASGEPGHFEWPHVAANLRKMVAGTKESPRKGAAAKKAANPVD